MKIWEVVLVIVVGLAVCGGGVALTVPRQQAAASPSGMKFEKLRCVEQQVTCWIMPLPIWTYWAKGTLLYDSGNPVSGASVKVTDGISTKGPDTTDTEGKFAIKIPKDWAADTITAKSGTLAQNFECNGNYVDCDGDGSCLPVDEVCAGSVGGVAEFPDVSPAQDAAEDTGSWWTGRIVNTALVLGVLVVVCLGVARYRGKKKSQ